MLSQVLVGYRGVMNAPIDKAALAGAGCQFSCLDEAHIQRSKLVEKCTAAERWITEMLRSYGYGGSLRASLSSKIETLRKLADPQKRPKTDNKLLRLLDELSPLAELRSELAHSTMTHGTEEGRAVIILRNAAENHPFIDRRVIVSASNLRDANRQLSNIANQLKQLANPASPPQPTPAATTDP